MIILYYQTIITVIIKIKIIIIAKVVDSRRGPGSKNMMKIKKLRKMQRENENPRKLRIFVHRGMLV